MENFNLNNFISEEDFNLFKNKFFEELKKSKNLLKPNQKDPNIFYNTYNKLFNEYKFPREIYSELMKKLWQKWWKDKNRNIEEEILKTLTKKTITTTRKITEKLWLSESKDWKPLFKKIFWEMNDDEIHLYSIYDCNDYAAQKICENLWIEVNDEIKSLFLDWIRENKLYKYQPDF